MSSNGGRQQIMRDNTHRFYSASVLLVLALVLVAGSILYTNYVRDESERHYRQLQRESEHKWCTIVVSIDDAGRVNPPTTERARQFAQDMHRLRLDLGC
jgi:hypothetical protein